MEENQSATLNSHSELIKLDSFICRHMEKTNLKKSKGNTDGIALNK